MTDAVARQIRDVRDDSLGVEPVVSSPATLRALVLYFLGLGTWGFGGPLVLVERMRRDLQDENVGGQPALRILEPNASPSR